MVWFGSVYGETEYVRFGFLRSRWKPKPKSNRFRVSVRFFRSRWKPKPNSFSARFGYFRSRWKIKPKSNHFRFSVRFFQLRFFGFSFSFFGFGSVWFLLTYLLQFHSNSIQPNTTKMRGQIPFQFHQIPFCEPNICYLIQNQTTTKIHLQRLI